MLVKDSISKPALLIVTSRCPFPVIGGDRLRVYQLAKYLNANFEITILCICEDKGLLDTVFKEEAEFHKVVKFYLPSWKSKIRTLKSLLSRKPLQVTYYLDSNFGQLVEIYSSSAKVTIFHLIRTAEYVDKIPNSSIKILEMTDAISRNYGLMKNSTGFFSLRKYIFSFESKILKEYEALSIKRFNRTVLVSKVDSNYLVQGDEKKILENGILICPNGIDLNKYPFESTVNYSDIIVFVGNLTSLQNFDACYFFATQILPTLCKTCDIKFKVIGRIGENDRKKLEGIQNVVVTGEVDSIAEAMRGAWLGVCPVRVAAGMQNKILEYMAVGLPAITTENCATAIGLEKNKNILIADTVEQYVSQIETLRFNRELYSSLKLAGRQFVELNSCWSKCLAPLGEYLEDSRQVSVMNKLNQ